MTPAISLALCGLMAATGAATPPPRVDRVERVVVFADRAEVTRAAPARCEGGAAAVVFPQLPDAVDPRTLRGTADGDATVVGVSSTAVEQTEALDSRVRELQEELRKLEVEAAALRRAQGDDDERLRSLGSYGAWFRTALAEDLRQPKPDVGRYEQLLTTLTDESRAAAGIRVQRHAQLRKLERQHQRVAHRLERLSALSTTAPANVTATVSVRCGKTGSPAVRLSYVVPSAGWSPEYDLRFQGPTRGKTGEGRATLTVASVIRQSSGEDWNDVEVWLSTAKPKLGGEAPLPNPIWVSGAPEDSGKQLVQAQEERAADLKGGRATDGAVQGAALDDGGKVFVLKLPRHVTVRADGRPYWFPVDDLNTTARSALVAVPARAPWVYQVASFANPAAFPLVEGTIHVFRGGTFVGSEHLEYRAPGEPIELSLGVDEEIALERTDLLRERREAGFFSGSQHIAQAFRTTLRNRSEQEVTVEVREQIPVSKSADIKVTVEPNKTAPGYTVDAVRGHLRWVIPLKKGASASRDLAFTIALPKEWALQ